MWGKKLDIDWMGTAEGGYVDTKTGRISEPDEVEITFEIIHCGASECGWDSYSTDELLEKEKK